MTSCIFYFHLDEVNIDIALFYAKLFIFFVSMYYWIFLCCNILVKYFVNKLTFNMQQVLVLQKMKESPKDEKKPGQRAAQLLSSLDGGEILPEADIVCNIIEKLDRNLRAASCILNFINNKEEVNDHFLVKR